MSRHAVPQTASAPEPPASGLPQATRLSRLRDQIRRLRLPLAVFALGSLCLAGVWIAVRYGQPAMSVLVGPDAFQSPLDQFDLDQATVPREQIIPGGPPKDGIPSLTDPDFVEARQAGFLDPQDRVVGIAIGSEARAYPLKILDSHEAVNDTVGGRPLLVTYCPLCDSAAAFDRTLDDGPAEFGISGLLYNSNVLLYDRRTPGEESLWSQMTAEAVAGPRVGERLTVLPLELTTWADWSRRFPRTRVLSRRTGYRRPYDGSAYAGYFEHPGLMFPVHPLDDRLPMKAPVLGVRSGDAARAYPVSAFESPGTSHRFSDELRGNRLTVEYLPKAGALRVVEADAGVEWVYSYWFAWAAFHPETEVFAAPE